MFSIIKFILSLLLKIFLLELVLKLIGTPNWACILIIVYLLSKDIKGGIENE